MKNVYLLLVLLTISVIFLNYYFYILLKRLKFLSKLKNIITLFASSILIIIFFDFYIFKLFGHGFPSSISEEKLERAPSPFDMFSGKDFYNDHNSIGFRGKEFTNSNKETFQIAFFGGSTGYNGNPPIIELVHKNLNNLDIKNRVFNFSSVSSNHNQHLHRLLKHSYLKFDLVIFYGGFNETLQTFLYDPRPGYPFNFFIRNELSPFKYLLLKHSSILAEYEKKTGNISGVSKIKENINFQSNDWLNLLLKNYSKTLIDSKNLSEKFINSNKCSRTKFLAFYQPISLNRSNEYSKKIITETKKFISDNDVIIDISEIIDENEFTDSVHVSQNAKEIIAKNISSYIVKNNFNKCI